MLAKRGVQVDKVLNFAIDDAILEERITGRWIHPSSGRTYHTKFAPPKVPGVDDVCIMFSLAITTNEIVMIILVITLCCIRPLRFDLKELIAIWVMGIHK